MINSSIFLENNKKQKTEADFLLIVKLQVYVFIVSTELYKSLSLKTALST